MADVLLLYRDRVDGLLMLSWYGCKMEQCLVFCAPVSGGVDI